MTGLQTQPGTPSILSRRAGKLLKLLPEKSKQLRWDPSVTPGEAPPPRGPATQLRLATRQSTPLTTLPRRGRMLASTRALEAAGQALEDSLPPPPPTATVTTSRKYGG